jgi:hypothetical protein
MNNKNCILVKTKDKRRFLTYKKNAPLLIEFSKTFGAEISIVQIQNSEKVLKLEELVPAICDGNYNYPPKKYQMIEKILPKNGKSRKDMLENSKKIRNYIQRELIKGKEVSLKSVRNKFKDLEITSACLCNHIKKVIKDMNKNGNRIQKTGLFYKICVK